ncbi:PQQ-like beta-propeller repeat protein [Couchioplanes caeruleus]|uniref:PQQ-like beta-propeller repeat protein n=1 Tax=Couchioplanes caeruleus TaxID=56438 RepID=UPI0020C11C79|nr:PQQ-like beta-propeller repeat protein [Couchioplanes caeruleus]UQU65178.1 PQQ-like beta-propeller repeat protein [Couchioplanes caeruleus]
MMVLGALVVAVTTVAGPAQAAPSQSSDVVPGFNGTVRAVAYSGGTIYVGGDFTSAVVKGKSIARTRLAAVNAYTGELLPWAPTADARVKAIAVSGSSVYIGGEFTYVSGQKRDSLARLDATSGAVSSTFKHAIDGKPYALAAANGRLYVGGTITKVSGQVRTRLAAFDLLTGALDGSWKPTVDDQVETFATASGRVYVGGKFHKVNSTSGYDRLVALNPTSGAIVTGFKPKPAVIVFGIAVTADSVYTAHGGQGGTATAYTLSGGKRWSATFDGDAQAITSLGDTVYVGGHFDNACRTARTGTQGVCLDGSDPRVKLAALDVADGHLRDWTANANGIEGVLTMAVNPGLGAFAAGGAFTTINGVSQKRLAQFR